MKFTNNKKVALTTIAATMISTVVNATASSADAVSKNLGDWVAIVAQVLSILCLVIFAMYMGRYLTIKTDKNSENDEKVLPGVRNGIMTCLIGIAICQAAIIVAQLCF